MPFHTLKPGQVYRYRRLVDPPPQPDMTWNTHAVAPRDWGYLRPQLVRTRDLRKRFIQLLKNGTYRQVIPRASPIAELGYARLTAPCAPTSQGGWPFLRLTCYNVLCSGTVTGNHEDQ
jgi:hypothetical protein